MRIDLQKLKDSLPFSVLYFDQIDSTSLFCKARIHEKKPFEGLVIAGVQTNGQGRTGKTFFSPENTGLYLTFSFPWKEFCAEHLTPRIALATALAIESVLQVSCGIKWVNDIYLGKKKVAGILCQKVEDFILIGIGINVEKPKEIPLELLDRLGYLTEKCEDSVFTGLVLAISEKMREILSISNDELHQKYTERCIHFDAQVEIEQDGQVILGICRGISKDFALLVEIDCVLHSFDSGYMVLRI